jgi:hypothetical protein
MPIIAFTVLTFDHVLSSFEEGFTNAHERLEFFSRYLNRWS